MHPLANIPKDCHNQAEHIRKQTAQGIKIDKEDYEFSKRLAAKAWDWDYDSAAEEVYKALKENNDLSQEEEMAEQKKQSKRRQLLKQIDNTIETIYSYIGDTHKQIAEVYSITLPEGHMICYTHSLSLFGDQRPYTKMMFIRNDGELTVYAYGLSLLSLEDAVMYDTEQSDDLDVELEFLNLFKTHLEKQV